MKADRVKKAKAKQAEVKTTPKFVLRRYAEMAKELRRPPTMEELRASGISHAKVRHHFGSYAKLREAAMEAHPAYFKGYLDSSIFNDAAMQALNELVGETKRLLVTTVVAGAPVHRGFQRALEARAASIDGAVLYVPVADPASRGGFILDPAIPTDRVVMGDLRLNDSIYVSTIKMSAKQIDPTTGINRLGHRRSFIFGSPKQRMAVKPNEKTKHPHVFMGTGAVTKPAYETDRYMSERTAKLAEYDHVMGALVVDIVDDKYYHFRQVQADRRGSFIDLGVRYSPDGSRQEVSPEYFVLGDFHAGEEDPSAVGAWLSVIYVTGVKNLVVHDFLNGHSISHWMEGKILDKAMAAVERKTSLEEEGRYAAQCMQRLLASIPGRVYVAYSNHDDFLYRYLNDSRFVRDHENLSFVSKFILPKAVQGENPAKVLIEHFLPAADRKRIVWWKEDADFRYAGVLLSAHGHAGPNGSRGTVQNHMQAYGPCVIGHSHTPGIYQEAYQVGTTSIIDPRYTRGASSWMHTSCLLYPNGSRQLINSIEGKWCLPPTKEEKK